MITYENNTMNISYKMQCMCNCKYSPGAHLTNDISIKFEIQWYFAMFLFIIYSADHNEYLHTSRQWHCRDVSKISLWSVEHTSNQSPANFDRISYSIEISLVGWAPSPMTENLIQTRFDGLHFPGDDGAVIWPDYFIMNWFYTFL